MPDETVLGLRVGHVAKRPEHRRGQHETAGVDRIPRLESLSNGDHAIAFEAHFCRIGQVQALRCFVDQHTPTLGDGQRRRQPRQHDPGEEVIDHLQKKRRAHDLLSREERDTVRGRCIGRADKPDVQPDVQRLHRSPHAGTFVPDYHDRRSTAARFRMSQRMSDERDAGHRHQRLRHVAASAKARAVSRSENHGFGNARGTQGH